MTTPHRCSKKQKLHLALSRDDEDPLLEGVLFGEAGAFPRRVAARFSGADLGEPRGSAGARRSLPRVVMGESGAGGACFPGLEDCCGPTAAIAAARFGTEPPALGEEVGVVAAPRFTGVFLGDTGTLLADVAAACPRGTLEEDDRCFAAALPLEASDDREVRLVAGSVRPGVLGERGAVGDVLPSLVCLMFLNCRRISAS